MGRGISEVLMTLDEAKKLSAGDTVFYCDSARGTVKSTTDQGFTVSWDRWSDIFYRFSEGTFSLVWTTEQLERSLDRRRGSTA
jgi:hypothetical protein